MFLLPFNFVIQLPEKGRGQDFFTSFKGTFIFSGNDSLCSGYYMLFPNMYVSFFVLTLSGRYARPRKARKLKSGQKDNS